MQQETNGSERILKMSTILPSKQTCQELAAQIHSFHVHNVKTTRGWSIRDSARALNRSIGSTSEYILLAEYLRAHSELAAIKKYNDAVDWMNKKKKELRER
jgi:hypothetical protein